MPVPASINDLSTTPSGNSPAGSEQVFPLNNDYIQSAFAFIALLRDKSGGVLSSVSGTDTITATLTGYSAYTEGSVFLFTPTGANASTTVTLNVNAMGAKPIKYAGAALATGYLAAVPVILIYDGTQFVVVNPLNVVDVIRAQTIGGAKTFSVAPASSVAAAAATELVRKQEMDAAILNALPVGSVQPMMRLTAPTGWLVHDNKTIGSASSGATARANADTQTLFELLWAFDNAVIPIYTSAGALSTRGASAAADFAANKRIALSASAGGHFNEAWTPTQTVDAGRIAGSVANANAGRLEWTILPDDGDAQVGANKSVSGLIIGGITADANNQGNVPQTSPIAADNSTTKPYSVAMPQYIKYA